MLLNNQWTTEKIKGKKVPRDKWQWKLNDPKPMECRKSSSKGGVYSNTILPQETRKTTNKNPNLYLK